MNTNPPEVESLSEAIDGVESLSEAIDPAEDTLVWFSVSAGPAAMSAFLTQEQATELRDLLTSELEKVPA
jgi:hypothetical protein